MTLHFVYGDTPIGEYFPTWDALFLVCGSLEQSDPPSLAICKIQNKGSSSGEDIIPHGVYPPVKSIGLGLCRLASSARLQRHLFLYAP